MLAFDNIFRIFAPRIVAWICALVMAAPTAAETPPRPKTAQAEQASILPPIFDLPVPGFCPKAGVKPDCLTRLKEYETAYVDLHEAIRRFHSALDPAFAPEVWGGVEQPAKFLEIVGTFAEQAQELNTKRSSLKSYKFVDGAAKAAKARTDYLNERKKWTESPLPPNSADTVNEKWNAYVKALDAAHVAAGEFGTAASELTELKGLADKLATAIQAFTAKQNEVPVVLTAYANKLTDAYGAEKKKISFEYEKTKLAAEAAIRSGVKLQPKPAPPPPDGAVYILDALYGESKLLDMLYEQWEGSGSPSLAELVPLDGLDRPPEPLRAKICRAHDYVKAHCEFVETRYCWHKDAHVPGSGNKGKVDVCTASGGPAEFTVPIIPEAHVIRAPNGDTRRMCSFVLRPDRICGGAQVAAPAPDRHALVLWRCGSGGPAQAKRITNGQQVYLVCGADGAP